MPVRTIPPSYRAITGRLAAAKSVGPAHFESALERDYLMTLEADPSVVSYEIQPLRLDYRDALGHKRHYTLDVLVKRENCTELCEVKYVADIKALRHEHRERWLVAYHYALERGWAFRLITEYHARHPRMHNWLFLSPYRICNLREPVRRELTGVVADHTSLTIREWLSLLPEPLTEWLEGIWHLIATGKVIVDMNTPLSLDSLVYVAPLRTTSGGQHA